MNYIDENNHEHIKNNYINLEDSNARAVWALGTVISLKDYLSDEIIDLATFCFIDRRTDGVPSSVKTPNPVSNKSNSL